jgi:hypothetical protein
MAQRQMIALLVSIAGGVASVEVANAFGLDGIAAYGAWLGCLAVFVMPAVIVSAGGFGPRRPGFRRGASKTQG